MSPDVPGATSRDLLEYATEQKIFQIGNTKVGGRPGAQPTVLIGTTFYHKHDVVTNADRGEINAEEAEKRIRVQEDFSRGRATHACWTSSGPRRMEWSATWNSRRRLPICRC